MSQSPAAAAGADMIADALVAVAGAVRWPDGQLVIDLAESVIRGHVAPRLAEEIGRRASAGASR